MYSKIGWKNHVVEFPNRRAITDNEDGTYTLHPRPGEIIQKGTPQSAENFNHMDDGIFDLYLSTQVILQSELHSDPTEFFQVDQDGNYTIPGYYSEKNVFEATKEDIQRLVGEVWDEPYEPEDDDLEADDFATDDDIRNLFK